MSWVRDVDRWFRDNVSPHEGLFLLVARRLTGNLEAARDLVHDAYANVLADNRWQSVQNPKAFVRQTIANLAVDAIRRNKVVPIDQYADVDQLGHMDLSPDAFQTVSDRERLQSVLTALDKLPRTTRQVFIMRRVDDVAPGEIARELGITLGAVEGHLARGMAELTRQLENQRKSVDLKVWLARREDAGYGRAARKEKKR